MRGHQNTCKKLVDWIFKPSLYFGGEEYEGLHPNTCPLIKNNHLYDVDNDEIPIRNPIKGQVHVFYRYK